MVWFHVTGNATHEPLKAVEAIGMSSKASMFVFERNVGKEKRASEKTESFGEMVSLASTIVRLFLR
jgi:hypothetical protein